MKKVFIIFLSLLACKSSFARDAGRGLIYARGHEATQVQNSLSQNIYDKRMARIYGISGLVLCGSGMATGLYAGIFMTGATTRDMEQFHRIQTERNKYLIVAGSLVAASVPLFILGKHHHSKYKNSIVLNFHAEPVHGFKGQELQVASLSLKIGL